MFTVEPTENVFIPMSHFNCKSENITQDYSILQELLARGNINFPELQQYALDAAHFSTDLPELDFAVSDHVISCDNILYIIAW